MFVIACLLMPICKCFLCTYVPTIFRDDMTLIYIYLVEQKILNLNTGVGIDLCNKVRKQDISYSPALATDM